MSEKYTNVVKVYLTDDQLDRIKQYAQNEGLRLSPYLRNRGLLKVPFTKMQSQMISYRRIQEEFFWEHSEKTEYHGGTEDKQKVALHQMYMNDCIRDPEFQDKLKEQKRKVERSILLASRPIPKGGK